MIKIAIDNDHIAQKTSGHLNVSGSFDSISVDNKACSTIHRPVLVISNSINTEKIRLRIGWIPRNFKILIIKPKLSLLRENHKNDN